MSEIVVYARAPTREAGIAFMEATGVAEEVNGRLLSKVQCHISTSDDFTNSKLVGEVSLDAAGCVVAERSTLSGWFVNIRYYGESVQALAKGGDPTAIDLFDRYPGLLLLSEARTGKVMVWKALLGDPTPPGYENEDGIRLYDPSFISTPLNVFA